MLPLLKRLSLGLVMLAPIVASAASPQELWSNHCAECHGSDGSGKTKVGKKFHIKDYTDARVQASFSDQGLLKNLLLGIADDSVGDRMPAFKDKLTAAEARELVALIRSFKK